MFSMPNSKTHCISLISTNILDNLLERIGKKEIIEIIKGTLSSAKCQVNTTSASKVIISKGEEYHKPNYYSKSIININ